MGLTNTNFEHSTIASHDSLADLLARCALHDRRAFETLYQQASPMLYGLLLKLTHDRELAADLLQEGFVRIWQRADDYRLTLGQPLTWMGTIVRRLAIDRLRRSDYRDVGNWMRVVGRNWPTMGQAPKSACIPNRVTPPSPAVWKCWTQNHAGRCCWPISRV